MIHEGSGAHQETPYGRYEFTPNVIIKVYDSVYNVILTRKTTTSNILNIYIHVGIYMYIQ